MKWYVLRAAGGKERKAKEYLEKEIERSGIADQVGQVLVPVKKEIVTKNGKRKAVDKLLFPGYVLIEATLTPVLENIIRNLVPGMSGFLTEKKTISSTQVERIPVPIREDEVQRILGVQDENIDNAAETVVNYEIGVFTATLAIRVHNALTHQSTFFVSLGIDDITLFIKLTPYSFTFAVAE